MAAEFPRFNVFKTLLRDTFTQKKIKEPKVPKIPTTKAPKLKFPTPGSGSY